MVRFDLFGTEISPGEIWKIAAVFLLIISFLAPAAVKPFVDTFAYGTSYARVFGFAAYAVLLAFSPSIVKAFFGKKGLPSVDEKVVLGALLAVFAFGLFGHYWFYTGVGGDISAKYYVFGNEGYTSTHISHNHALKTIFCPLGLPADDYDCAAPMLPYLPPLHNFFGIIFAALATAACAIFYTRLERDADKIAYLLLTFSSLKSAVDGGIFNYENLVFFMLAAFLLYRKNRLAATLAGVVLWVPIVSATYAFYEPLRLAVPMLMFFYPVCLFALFPRHLFPLLIVALVAPSYILTYSEVVSDRWSPEECQNAQVNPAFEQLVAAREYAGCDAKVELACGSTSAANGTIIYLGSATSKPELLIAKSLSKPCGSGVFTITEVRGSITILSRKNASGVS